MEQVLINEQIILGVGYLLFFFILFRKKQRSIIYVILCTMVFMGIYYVLSKNIQTFFWGSKGDELFIGAFFTRVLHGQPFNDLYYSGLPPFYPPLYFWVSGLVAKLFTSSSVVTGKIGVLGSIIVWFFGSYVFQWIYWKKESVKIKVASSPWFWITLPAIYFIWLDFNEIITKPYETVSAILLIIWIGLFSHHIAHRTLNTESYLFFGITGGILFLTYHFWWFIIIPTLFTLALVSGQRSVVKNMFSVFAIGIIMAIIASPYLIPLFLSFQGGVENWQAIHMVPSDFKVFMPWLSFSIKGALAFLGLIGLVAFRKQPFVKASVIVLIYTYIWQLINFIIFLTSGRPVHSSKPYLFLGGVALMVGASYVLFWVYESYMYKVNSGKNKVVVSIFVFIALSRVFFFLNDPAIATQLELNTQEPKGQYLAGVIESTVPDYKDRIWLSSGFPELNLFIPLNYYLAHNAHFSHQASRYMERLKKVQSVEAFKTPEEFNTLMNELNVNSLLLFKDNQKNSFTLFYRIDNFPDGSKGIEVNLNPTLIDTSWNKVYSNSEWDIFIKLD